MATATLPPAVSLALNQETEISQARLESVYQRARLLEAMGKELEYEEDSILADLKSGYSVEPGEFSASVKTIARRSVAWRSVVERLRGVRYAERVLAATRPTVHESLDVRR